MRTFLAVVFVALHGYFLGSRIDTGDYGWACVHVVCIALHYLNLEYWFKQSEQTT